MKEFGTITLELLNGLASSLFLFILTLLISLPLGLLMCFCTMSQTVKMGFSGNSFSP